MYQNYTLVYSILVENTRICIFIEFPLDGSSPSTLTGAEFAVKSGVCEDFGLIDLSIMNSCQRELLNRGPPVRNLLYGNELNVKLPWSFDNALIDSIRRAS